MKKLMGFSLCLLFLLLTSCSKLYERNALNFYNEANYVKSIDELMKVSKNNVSSSTFILLGNNYYALGNNQKAFENYKIAVELNSDIIIRPLINLYFINDDIEKSLKLIQRLENTDNNLSIEERKIEYISLYRLGYDYEANKVLNNYLSSLDEFEITKLKILSFDNTASVISQSIFELCENGEYSKAEELLDMSYRYGNFNSGFLSVLNFIVENESINNELRAKAAYYSSFIFKSINNERQSNYFYEYYKSLSEGNQILIPNLFT